MAASGTNPVAHRTDFQVWTVNVCFHQEQSFRSLILVGFEGQLTAYSVEKLCFEMSGDFICDLSGIAYCMYEGVAEVA